MIFLVAIFVPPIALVMRDAKWDAIASLAMLCLAILLFREVLPVLWIAAIVHSFAVIRRQDADRRTQQIIAAIQGRQGIAAKESPPATGDLHNGQLALHAGE